MSARKKQQMTILENVIFSNLAAMLSKTVASPVEVAKLLKQLSPTLSETEDLPIYLANPSRITLLFLYQLVKDKGILTLFGGHQYNLLRYFPTLALNFLFKQPIMELLKAPSNASNSRKLISSIIAGGVAGSLSLAVTYPLDTYRTLYAIDIDDKYKSGQKRVSWSQLYAGMYCTTNCSMTDNYLQRSTLSKLKFLENYDILISIHTTHKQLPGFWLSTAGIMVYRAMYFGLYDGGKQFLPQNANFFIRFVFGYTVTMAAGWISYPIDTIRRRQMITNESTYQATKTLISNHGWSSLFGGAVLNIYRGLIGAGTLVAMDMVKEQYIDYKVNAGIRQKVREILKYRQWRNSILMNIDGVNKDRNDWNEIVNSVIIKYLDDYMQNEDIFKLKLTDSFAVGQQLQQFGIDDYLGIDMKFHVVVVDSVQ